eukprot:gene2217-4306_t
MKPFSLFILLVLNNYPFLLANEHPEETYKDICSNQWQKKYTQLHRSMISGQIPGKYVISAPFRTGLADIILGYITAFMISILSDRAFLILRGGYMVENDGHGLTKRLVDYAYHSPHINWTSPEIDQPIYQCLLPPYDHTMLPCSSDNKTTIYGKEYKVKHIHGVNGIILQKDTDCRTWYNEPNQLVLMTNNRGHTLDMLNNTIHGKTLREEFGLTPDTAFPCMFHYLFRMNTDVCTGECKKTEMALINNRHNKNPNIITIGIHARNGGGSDHFRCADSLIKYYKAKGIKVIMLYVTIKKSDQEMYKKLYGESLLLPMGAPSVTAVVHERGFKGDESADKQGMMDSARDYHLLSLTDIQIITARSGFGVVAAMMKPTRKHHIYRVDSGDRRECSDFPHGDPLESLAADWSHLRGRKRKV